MIRKRINKGILAVLLASAMLFSNIGIVPGVQGTVTAKAATYSHVKATQADFLVPTPQNSKGVQGSEVINGKYAEDLTELGINHTFQNVDLQGIICTDKTGTPYPYQGETYYFNEKEGSMMKVLENLIKQMREKNVAMTFCIVLSWSDDPAIQKLMFNPQPGKIYYALNMKDPAAAKQIEATLHFMADRFGYSDTFVQYWRIGNEVNVSHDYNFTGAGQDGIPLKDTIVDIAVASYDALRKALDDENPYARAYTSVTHDWNYNNEGKGVSTKDFIDAFAAKVKDKNWNIDFHAYPPIMKEQVWTQASAKYLTHEVTTNTICAPNFEVIVNYVKENYGNNHRFALSEQSYDSKYGEEEQAAMIAYTYYAAVNSGVVDNVIFTTWHDTNSEYHDFYDMGMLTIDGKKKLSYNVFKYMNTDKASVYVDPYLEKLSAWTGRTISSWSDDILYQAPKSDAVMTYATLYYPEEEQVDGCVYIGLTTKPTKDEEDLEFKWSLYNYYTDEVTDLTGWNMNNEWIKWYPDINSKYKITCTARVAGNKESMISASKDFTINYAGLPSCTPVMTPLVQAGTYQTTYQGYDFYKDDAGDVRCFDSNRNPVYNAFMCDGTYTYYFQYDHTAMRSRLTYHPDGVHVIYFDEEGHEVFSNFHSVKKSIAGDAVDDLCFFDVFGYMYVDVMTYGNADFGNGDKLYYINPYGVIERKGWFLFSDTAVWAGTTQKVGVGKGFGQSYDGSLLVNCWTFDENSQRCYLQGDGHAIYPN